MDITVLTATIPGREHLLEEAKASVRAQTLQPQDHLVQLDKERLGQPVILNRLTEQVTTDWIAFLDDDDLFLPHHLQVLAEAEGDIRYSDCEVTGRNWTPPNQDFDPELLRRENFIPITVLMRTDLFRQVGGFPAHAISYLDWELWKRCLEAGATFTHIPEVTWCYRFQPDSLTLSMTPQ